MLSVEAALARILAHVPSNTVEQVPLQSALGRVLAVGVCARTDLPPWDNSAMDGYAVRCADIPGILRVLETVAAGAVPTQVVGEGTAIRVMTGAPMPAGADAVVMVEDTVMVGEGVQVSVGAKMGQHIRRRGSNLYAGVEILAAGRVLNAAALGLCAAVGVPVLRVWARPRVAILSTGDEIVEAGLPLGPGQIWSSNTQALAGLVTEAGGIPVDLGCVRDDVVALRAAFSQALRCDIVLSTGGVSVGDFDFVKDVMVDLGVEMDFWKVWMKPGKPLAFGMLGSRPVFGLPGNPVSCMVNFLQFVRPVIRRVLGDPQPFLPVMQARMEKPWKRRADRPELVRVRLRHDGMQLWASVVGFQGSDNLVAMADAHGFAMVAADQVELVDLVWVQVFDTSFLSAASAWYAWPDGVPGHGSDRC